MRSIEKTNRLPKLTGVIKKKKQLIFLRAWIRNSLNATAAYQELHPDVRYSSAKVLGSKILTKINLSELSETFGLDVVEYFVQLKKGLNAKRWNKNTKQYEYDYQTRLPYLSALGRILGIKNLRIHY